VPDAGFATGDPAAIAAISAHIERHVGPIETVLHEIVSSHVHVDVHHVAPSAQRRYHVLVTSGMSDRAMVTPEGAAEWRHAELLVCLPADWPVNEAAFADERHYWPVRLLKTLARFPHEFGTWLGYGHSMPNGDPPEPYAPGTSLAGVMLMPPLLLGEEVHRLEMSGDKRVHFWSLLPLHADEMDLKIREGSDALLDRLDAAAVTDLVDPGRPSVVAPKKRWWDF
jgi:hypothetical protein